MGRGKVVMEFIGSEKTRMLTFQNRKKSLFKKAYELSVLCDVDVCIIINGFLTGNQQISQSEIWPEDSKKVRRILTKYEATNPNARRRTTSSLSSFFLERQENSSKKVPFPLWDSRLDSFSAAQTFKLSDDLGEKLKMMDKRMDELQTHVDDQLPIVDSSSGAEQIINEGWSVFGSPPETIQIHVDDQLPIVDSSSGAEQIINEDWSVFGSPPDEFFDDFAMNWVNQNFKNDFPLNNEKPLDFQIESIPENYNNLPDHSTVATIPSQSRGLPPLPPSSMPSVPFLGRPGSTWSGFFDGDCDYQINDNEEERFYTLDSIANFLCA